MRMIYFTKFCLGNIAYSQTTTQGPRDLGASHRAVDGLYPDDFTQCARPAADGTTNPFWIVSFGADHVIYNITVYTYNYYEDRSKCKAA